MSDASESDRESTRSRLIRELARSSNRQRPSAPGEVDVTSTSFNPSEEAEMSTRKLDEPSNTLPELRDSAKRYRMPRKSEPEPDVSTSQLGLAFPDFTQGLPSSDESMSVEMGRGAPMAKYNDFHDFSSSGFNGSFGAADSVRNQTTSTHHQEQETSTTPQKQKAAFQRSSNTGETRFSTDFGDMPNLSELVSGIFENGTPIFSRLAPRPKSQPEHAPITKLPVPEDDQAIYVSLKLLQEKVAQLETNKAADAAAIQELRSKNQALVQEKEQYQRSRRSDSAYASSSGSDAAEEHNIGFRKTKIEKLRLEASVRDLQEKLDKAEHRYNASATAIKTISEERDSVTAQVGAAYLTIQSLKSEIRSIQVENDELKEQLRRFEEDAVHNPEVVRLREVVQQLRSGNEALKERISQATTQTPNASLAQDQQGEIESLKVENRQLRARIQYFETESTIEIVSARRLQKQLNVLNAENLELRARIEDFAPEPTTDLDAFVSRRSDEDNIAVVLPGLETNGQPRVQPTKSDRSRSREDRLGFNSINQMRNSGTKQDYTTSKDLNLYPEISQALNAGDVDQRRENIQSRQVDQPSKTPEEHTHHTMKSNITSDVHTQPEISLLEHRSRRGGVAMEEMTSAFILPDVTIHNAGLATSKLQFANSEGFERLIEHDLRKCNVCQRLLEPGKAHGHKVTKTIHKPVPVSERAPSPTPSNEDPTMRPSQSPGMALARVISDLEDECKHLKMTLRKLEDVSHQQIPALSKSKRVRLETKITLVRGEISSKSDQIYALYDVLEGQKLAGQEMSQLEVEITLHDLGIDTGRFHAAGDAAKNNMSAQASGPGNKSDVGGDKIQMQPLKSALKRPTSKHAWDDLTDGNSLPWEGFESTADEDHTASTRRSSSRVRRF